MPPSSGDQLFGKIAIKNRLVTESRVRECLDLLARSGGNGVTLGKVLLQKGYITANDYRAIARRVEGRGGDGSDGKGGKDGKDGKDAGLSNGAGPAVRAVASGGEAIPRVTSPAVAAKMNFSALAGKPLSAYLEVARKLGASDFHFQVGSAPFVKLHGHIVFLRHPKLEAETTARAALETLSDYERDMFERHLSVDFCYELDHGRYRANVFRQRKGIDAIFRIIPDHVPTLEELHLPDALRKFCSYRQGLVLITGSSGSGKSSTMAALIDIINEERHDHIVTVEDPIEFIIEGKNCNVNQRHVGVHTENYATALRSAMRADPDYISVGELRDLETISTAITAAETGHLVFGTLHTTNATRSVDRIIDAFSPREQDQIRAMVSESLRGVISQQLLPRADGKGREPALEILFATPAVGNMIRERKTFQLISVLQTGAKQGMVMLDDSIAVLLRKGLVTREVAQHYASNPTRFKKT